MTKQWKRRLVVCGVVSAGLGFVSAGASAAPILAIDFNDRSSTEPDDTAPGFSPFTMPGTTAPAPSASGSFGAFTVNLTVFDADGATGGAGMMDDRDRALPTSAPNYNQLYDDLIFVGNSAGDVGGGLDIAINSGGTLAPNSPYLVSIYAFDGAGSVNTPVRSAAWTDANNANGPLFTTAFTVNVPPVTDDQYKFTGVAMTDAQGNLLIQGRDITAGDIALYVNGLEVNEVPEPGMMGLAGLAAVALAGRGRRRGGGVGAGSW